MERSERKSTLLHTPTSEDLTPEAVLSSLEISQRLFTQKSVEDIGRFVAHYGCEALGADLIWVGLMPAKGERHLTLHGIHPVRESDRELVEFPWHEVPGAQDPVARVILTGEECVINDLEMDFSSIAWKSAVVKRGYRSSAAFPVFQDRDLIGVVNVFSLRTWFFMGERLKAIEALSQVTGLALERFQLSEQAKRTSKEIEESLQARSEALEHQFVRLAALAEVSLFSDDPTSVLEGVAETTARLLPASGGASIILWDDKAQKFYTSVSTIPGQGRDSTATRVRREGGATRWIVENREPLTISDIKKMPFSPNPMHQEYGIKSFAGIPVIANKQVLGVLYALDRQPRNYSQEDLDFLTTMANRVGAALMTLKLIESEREQRKFAEVLREVTSDLNSSLELPVILNRLLEHLGKIIPYDCGFVLIEEGGRFRTEAVRGKDVCDSQMGTGVPECYGQLFETVRADRLPHVYDDIRALGTFNCCRLLDKGASVLTLPLASEERIVGMLALTSHQAGFYREAEADVAFAFAQQAAIAVRNANLFTEVKRMATQDPLTRIFNRGHFFELATHAFKSAVRYKRDLSVFMMDIDSFKSINDRYGHQVGDEVLRAVVNRFKKIIRDIDLLGRYGGDEFVVLLPETELDEARRVAERLREKIRHAAVQTSAGPVEVTISVGIATLTEHTPTLAVLLKKADMALYRAKSGGRNCVTTGHDE